MNQYMGPILAVLGPCAVLIIKALAEKLTARIKNIPDAKTRRESTKNEHDAELAKMQEILDLLAKRESAELRALKKQVRALEQQLAEARQAKINL
jgi:hypothetical protein